MHGSPGTSSEYHTVCSSSIAFLSQLNTLKFSFVNFHTGIRPGSASNHHTFKLANITLFFGAHVPICPIPKTYFTLNWLIVYRCPYNRQSHWHIKTYGANTAFSYYLYPTCPHKDIQRCDCHGATHVKCTEADTCT